MTLEEATTNIINNMNTIQSMQPTMQEASQALSQLGPAMQTSWQQCLDDDALWEQRAKHHGALKTWWLRWQLRRKA